MTGAPGQGPPARPGAPGDALGLGVALLIVALAAGTALPQLGGEGPSFPPPPDPELRAPPAPPVAAVSGRLGASLAAGRSAGAMAARPKPLLAAPLDLNTSDAETLQALPGVGPSLAQGIVVYREAHGRFQTAEDLLRVPGIGPKRWERIRPLVRVAEGP